MPEKSLEERVMERTTDQALCLLVTEIEKLDKWTGHVETELEKIEGNTNRVNSVEDEQATIIESLKDYMKNTNELIKNINATIKEHTHNE